jgi:gluconate kinase
MLLFLFGKPGTGKTTMGRYLSKLMNAVYFDCDDCYTLQDIDNIKRNNFTCTDSDEFLVRAVGKLKKIRDEDLVITSQSLFKEHQRRLLKNEFQSDIFLVYLDLPRDLVIERLKQRRHFYDLQQYLREEHEYDAVKTFDVSVMNINIDETAKNIEDSFCKFVEESE